MNIQPLGRLEPLPQWLGVTLDHLSYGKIIAVVDLVDCIPTDKIGQEILDREGFLGDYGVFRFAWKLENLRVLSEPIPYKGLQWLFNVPDELFKEAA